ncbi:uncharacterized protein LOC144470720 [Augochlora pura]
MDTVKIDSGIANCNEKIYNKDAELRKTNSKDDSGICDTDVSLAFCEDLAHANKWSSNLLRDATQESDRISTAFKCSDTISNNESTRTTQFEQHAEQDNDLLKNPSNLSNFSSGNTRSYLRNTFANAAPGDYVISDSQSERSSCSDMFKDTEESRELGNNARKGKVDEISYTGIDFINKLIAIGFLPSQVYTPCCNDSSNNIISETKSDLFADESNSNVTFNESCSLFQEDVDNSYRDDEKVPGLSILGITQIAKVYYSQELNSSKRDSTRDIFESNGENCFTENGDESDLLNLEIDGISGYQSLVDDLKFPTLSMDVKEGIIDRSQEPYMSSLKLYSENIDFVQTVQNISKDVVTLQQNGRFSREDDSVEDEERMETSEEKRNLNLESKMDVLCKNEGERVFSKWLTFTRDAHDTSDVHLRSMKVTLSVLLDEEVATRYMRHKRWKDTIEMRTVNAILKFCDAFESANKSKACMNEIIQVVANTLDKCIGNTELGKITITIHQINIILELCGSKGICVEVINYLLTRLKSYESSLASLMAGKKADVHSIASPLHIIFYSLNLCLEKYRSVVSGKDDNRLEEQTIPPITDLWKKQFSFEGISTDESRQMRERRWQTILNDFTAIAGDSFIRFTEMSRRLFNMLTNK